MVSQDGLPSESDAVVLTPSNGSATTHCYSSTSLNLLTPSHRAERLSEHGSPRPEERRLVENRGEKQPKHSDCRQNGKDSHFSEIREVLEAAVC
ncbi:hypothetical protein MHYP_G00032840 [Metynnis hypsauchen]